MLVFDELETVLPRMNSAAFHKVIDATRFRATDKVLTALELVLVYKEQRATAVEKTGIEPGSLSKAMKRFEKTMNEYCLNQGLVHEDYLLSPPHAALAAWAQINDLHDLPLSNEKRERINRLTAELITELQEIDNQVTLLKK